MIPGGDVPEKPGGGIHRRRQQATGFEGFEKGKEMRDE
jgi:hypothetical protein